MVCSSLLTLLYFFVAHPGFPHPVLYIAAIAVYGALVLTLRFAGAPGEYPREKLVRCRRRHGVLHHRRTGILRRRSRAHC